MTNQVETGVYAPGVYQWELTDPVQGGIGNIANLPLLQLTNRTAYLKAQTDSLSLNLSSYALINSQAFTGTPSAPTPATTDRSTRLATTAFAAAVAAATAGQPFSNASSNTTVQSPAWAVRIEAWLVGSGGGGSLCGSVNTQGGGGGAGADLHALWPCPANTPVEMIVGQVGVAGNEMVAGSPTILQISGAQVGLCNGGGGAAFTTNSSQVCPGGIGGTWSISGGGTVIRAKNGENGSDGQNGTRFLPGNGGDGPWGGGGPCANGGRGNMSGPGATPLNDASGYGSGGGGAYCTDGSGTQYVGGSGAGGVILYRFLPA